MSMKPHPFTQLFVTPVSKVGFVKDALAGSPKAPEQKRIWRVYASRVETIEVDIEAINSTYAGTMALKKLQRENGKYDWQIDHVTPNLQYPHFRRK